MRQLRIRWANVALAVGATSLMGLLLLGVGEWLVRHREQTRTTVPGTMPLLFYQTWRTRHALVRDYDYFGWVRVNSQGFRGRELTTGKDSAVVRILAVGGSTTFDSFVTGDDQTWPARLEHWLNSHGQSRRVEVVNAGVPGYTVFDNLIRLQSSLHTLEPDLIIVYHGHNDLFAGLRSALEGLAIQGFSARPGAIDPKTPWVHWLEEHSLLYAKLAGRLSVIRFLRSGRQEAAQSVGERTVERAASEAASGFERDLTAFVALAHCFGTQVVVPGVVSATQADTDSNADSLLTWMWSHTVPFASKELVAEGYEEIRAASRRVAERFGATYINTDGFDVHRTSLYSHGDPVHFNDEGSDHMARDLADAIVTTRVLDHPPAPVSCGTS